MYAETQTGRPTYSFIRVAYVKKSRKQFPDLLTVVSALGVADHSLKSTPYLVVNRAILTEAANISLSLLQY
jgi:hypothetical protein